MIKKEEMQELQNTEQRLKKYSNLTDIIGFRELPKSMFDILNAVYPNCSEQELEARINPNISRIDFVGGGISGVTAAYVAGELSRRYNLGWEIHVWDRLDFVGLKSTKDSAARTRTSMFGSVDETRGNLATSLFHENLDSILRYGAREAGKQFDVDVHTGLSRCGYLWLFEDETSRERVQANQQMLTGMGIPSFCLNPKEVSQLVPGIAEDRFKLAYFCPTDAFVEPTSIVNALHAYASRVLGINFHFNEEIGEIRVDAGKKIRFTAQTVGNGAHHHEYETDRLGLTTGACLKEMGRRFIINGRQDTIPIQLKPVARQLTYVEGFTPQELDALTPFTILMGNGAYFSRESPASNAVIFGYARKSDPEVPSERIFDEIQPNPEYFVEHVLGEGRLDGIHKAITLDSERIHPIRHAGNLYGETSDGSYLIGLLSRVENARPDGKVGVTSGCNGHGIMSSLKSAVLLVYRLAGIHQEDNPLYAPSRDMKEHGGTQRL